MSLKIALISTLGLVATVLVLPGFLVFMLIAGSIAPPGPALTGANVAGSGDIPPVALAAYTNASAAVGTVVAGCLVPPWVLAGVGKVESNNAAGRSIDTGGKVSPPIIGPALDGSLPGTAVIADTDSGALDGDPVWDHAVGPMQILPATWRRWGRDGDGDGVVDPQNLFDAGLTAAVILCQPAANLAQPGPLSAALHAYNNSDAYVASVMSWAATYQAAFQAGPSPTP